MVELTVMILILFAQIDPSGPTGYTTANQTEVDPTAVTAGIVPTECVEGIVIEESRGERV